MTRAEDDRTRGTVIGLEGQYTQCSFNNLKVKMVTPQGKYTDFSLHTNFSSGSCGRINCAALEI